MGEEKKDEVVATAVVDTAFQVFRQLGSGLFESAYETVMTYELESRGYKVERQVSVPLIWKGQELGESYRADLVVEGVVLIELKSLESLSTAHNRQILTYLRLSKLRLGFLVNFGAKSFSECLHRFLNDPQPRG